jgi:hypothetical protein
MSNLFWFCVYYAIAWMDFFFLRWAYRKLAPS